MRKGSTKMGFTLGSPICSPSLEGLDNSTLQAHSVLNLNPKP